MQSGAGTLEEGLRKGDMWVSWSNGNTVEIGRALLSQDQPARIAPGT